MSRLSRLHELHTGLRARVNAELSPPARDSIADLSRHFADDDHLSPSQMADYRHRLASYAKPDPQRDLEWEPPTCA